MPSLDSLKTLKTLQVDDKTYHYFSLPDAAKSLGDLDKLPMSLKVLLENLLQLGFDERFMRLWEFYLAYCEAAFDKGNINLVQYTLLKK